MNRKQTTRGGPIPGWLLELLLKAHDEFGLCVLRLAVQNEDNEIVEALLKSGAKVNTLHSGNGRTPLHYAAETKNLKTLKMLIETPGVSLNVQDSNGETPLHIAARTGCVETVKMLLEANAEFDISNRFGALPVHIARLRARTREVEDVLNARYYRENRRPPGCGK